MRLPRLSRVWRLSAPALAGLLGAWIALLAFGAAGYRVGPLRVELDARPGSGITELALPPLGRVRADTHLAPLTLSARVDEVAPERAEAFIRSGDTRSTTRRLEKELRVAVRTHAWRTGAIALAGALVAAVVLYGKRRRAIASALAATFVATLLFGSAVGLGYRADAFAEPTFTGSLRLAPGLLGPIRDAPERIDAFRSEVERIVRGASRAYGVVAAEQPTQSRVVLLHVSDLHASGVGMDVAQELAAAFEVDAVLDTGDITSFNTVPERSILDRIPGFEAPYLFVRGNHDSPGTAALIEAQPNGTVLDGEVVDVDGLRIYGQADPEFTPAQPGRASDEERAELLRERGLALRRLLEVLSPPVDVLAVHDDRLGGPTAGAVPLVLSGHFHRAEQRYRAGTVFLRAGTTGAGGFDPFPAGIAKPHSAQILYFDGDPLRLVALDLVELDPETRALTVNRVLAERLAGEPAPAPSPRA